MKARDGKGAGKKNKDTKVLRSQWIEPDGSPSFNRTRDDPFKDSEDHIEDFVLEESVDLQNVLDQINHLMNLSFGRQGGGDDAGKPDQGVHGLEKRICGLRAQLETMTSQIDELQAQIYGSYETFNGLLRRFADQTKKDPSTLDGVVALSDEEGQRDGKYNGPNHGFQDDTVAGAAPLLRHLGRDYNTTVLVMRWIEFLLERVSRTKLIVVLDYYVDIGWITEDVKVKVIAFARGEMPDVRSFRPQESEEEEGLIFDGEDDLNEYKKADDWRLCAEDHLRSLLFVMRLSGKVVNKDTIMNLEHEVSKFKGPLERYYGI